MNESRIFSSLLLNECRVRNAKLALDGDMQMIIEARRASTTGVVSPQAIARTTRAADAALPDTADGDRLETRRPLGHQTLFAAMNGEASPTMAAPAQRPAYRHPLDERPVVACEPVHAPMDQAVVEDEKSLPDAKVDLENQSSPQAQPESSLASVAVPTSQDTPIPQPGCQEAVTCDELQPPDAEQPSPPQTPCAPTAPGTPLGSAATSATKAKRRPKSKLMQERQAADAGNPPPPTQPANDAEDDSSDERLITIKEVSKLVSLGRSSIYERINPKHVRHDPSFPEPAHLNRSRAVRWRRSEVLAWIKQQGRVGRGRL